MGKTAENKFMALCALLLVQGLSENEDGSVNLTAVQAEAVEKELARADGLDKEVQRLKGENARLQEQVDNLKDADGDDTDHVEGKDSGEDKADDCSRIRDNYNLIKDIL